MAETNEAASKPRAIRFIGELDGLVVDEQTGEILEWPSGFLGGDRTMTLIEAYADADLQVKRWQQTIVFLKSALEHIALETGAKKLTTDAGSVTLVRGGTRKRATAAKLQEAAAIELLTDEQVAFIAISAAKELDVEAVKVALGMIATDLLASNVEAGVPEEQATADAGRWKSLVEAVLIQTSTSAGHTRVSPAARLAPILEREDIEPFEVEEGDDDES